MKRVQSSFFGRLLGYVNHANTAGLGTFVLCRHQNLSLSHGAVEISIGQVQNGKVC